MTGHGHVVPRADGVLAKCGGPGICKACQAELAELQASARHAPPKPRDQLRQICAELFRVATPRERQMIAAMLAAVADIDRLQERITELEGIAADALQRNRQNPDA